MSEAPLKRPFRPLSLSLSVRDTMPYTIRALSQELGVTVRALHYYEQRGLLAPGRQHRARIYSRRDRGRVVFIQRCQRVGLSLRDIKTLLDIYDERGAAAQADVARRLLHRQFRILEARRDAAEAGLAALRAAFERLSDSPAP